MSDLLASKPPLIPVLHIENVEHAEPTLLALEEAGITAIEVTLRTTAAIKVIERMKRLATRAKIGAGTITRPEQFERVRDAGAEFAVSPALTVALAEAAERSGLAYRSASFPRLCLSFGALPRVSVQAKGKDEGDPTLARPVKRSANSRSVPHRCREGSHPLPAVPSPLRGAKSHKTSIFRSGCIVSCGGEIVGAFLRGEAAQGVGDGLPEVWDGSRRSGAQ
jgi:hypothetical protein